MDLLRRGNSNEESLKKLNGKDGDCIGIEEEEPLFWYALADTLWNYGRLTPEVKEKALYFLDIRKQRWHAGKMTVESMWRHGCERWKAEN